MTRFREFLAGLLTLVLLAVGLGIWIRLPWPAVLAITLGLALWLFLTRSGRLAREATRIGIAGLPQRWGASLVIVVGIAGVVGVLVAMLAMGEGFKATLASTGSTGSAILLRAGSQAETNSVIRRDQVPLLATLPGIARGTDGRPLASPELSQVVNLPTMAEGTDANVQFRGVGPAGWMIRPQLEIVQGRRFTPGMREIVVGTGTHQQFRGLEVGNQLKLANQLWTVVGRFKSGDSHDSELWADADVLGPAYQRSAFQSVTVKLDGKDGLARLKAALAADPRLKLDIETTRDYYGRQSEGLTRLIRILGTVIGGIMAIGAVFGALNTMYAAVAGRAREIATLRALGFRGLPVVAAVMLETMLLALLGGLLGAALAWLLFNGYTVSTLGQNFSQVVFQFRVSPELLWTGLKWALGIGLVGGLFPALRAARVPVSEALRAA
ncbi:MAG: ABC transporter permease [Thermomonas sp.]|jgi:putative ABC transport system permease protein|uniref:ABC transporter permease n=1 Tax=Thermomonas sp. TaxID=1971895 RepID=UPI001B4A2107|nr:ABC transporter permease [Thermomonas sp.]MBK6333784.1 ABC transporter permease [Thermomonas sp.]MBK6925578.1 ABC transporter permease [Thermomonas sp.]MBP6438577.1 ABC transporter permease [Thermomonas sp.]MBP7158439.1 ABC transporter permease [Thermomonas sp.]HQX94717.1 ABC transporter permease [Thermomonas sp.]